MSTEQVVYVIVWLAVIGAAIAPIFMAASH